MSTPTPTGNGHADHVGQLVAWMPDEATLTRLAGDVLASLAAEGLPGLDSGPPPPPPPAPAVAPAASPVQAPSHLSPPSYYFIDERPEPATANGHGTTPTYPASLRGDDPPRLRPFNVEAVRADFPILGERVNGRPLVWLDNAATTQKPRAVIDRLTYFYSHENSNIHRGAHTLAARATDAYEDARATVADFLGAPSSDSIVFTRGTTESINLIAQAWGRAHIGPGDEIVLSQLEHHANIVPWQQLADQVGARLRVIPVDETGALMVDRYLALLNDRTKLVAIAHVSNVLGTIVPVDQVIAAAHQADALVLVDGAQAVAHLPVDVHALNVDFYTFSGHKVFGPTGIGALYAKQEILAQMPPWQTGGNMISDVTFERTRYQAAPAKFEAGTGNIADAIGLAAALDYVTKLGIPNIGGYEHSLLEYATSQLATVPGLRMLGSAPARASTLTFVLDGHRPADIGSALDRQGIAVRAGHHCAQPILRRYGLESAVRPSLAMYNTYGEVDQLVKALRGLG